jgi:hypothetical protein
MGGLVRAAIAAALAASLMGGMGGEAAAALDGAEADLVAQINAFRVGRGLAPFTVSETLSASAKWHSTDMATKNYFSHTSSDGRSATQRMADAGYPTSGTWTGENVAAGYNTAAEVLRAWINSAPHLANLSSPNFRAIGVGRAYGAGSALGWYWTANFGGVVDKPMALASGPAPVASEPIAVAAKPVASVARPAAVVSRAAPVAARAVVQATLPARGAAPASQSRFVLPAPEETPASALGLRTGYRSWWRGTDWLDVRDVIGSAWLDEGIALMVEVR